MDIEKLLNNTENRESHLILCFPEKHHLSFVEVGYLTTTLYLLAD